MQGCVLGILVPRSFEMHLSLAPDLSRYAVTFYLFAILYGFWFAGYLIRIIGGSMERVVALCLSALFSIVGLFSVFSTPLPQQLIIRDLQQLTAASRHCKKNGDAYQEAVILSQNDNTLFLNLAQSIEFYSTSEDKEEFTDRLMAVYVREREAVFSLGWITYLKPFRSILWRCLLSILAITVFL